MPTWQNIPVAELQIIFPDVLVNLVGEYITALRINIQPSSASLFSSIPERSTIQTRGDSLIIHGRIKDVTKCITISHGSSDGGCEWQGCGEASKYFGLFLIGEPSL